MRFWFRIGVDEASYAFSFDSLAAFRWGLLRATAKLSELKDNAGVDEILAVLRKL